MSQKAHLTLKCKPWNAGREERLFGKHAISPTLYSFRVSVYTTVITEGSEAQPYNYMVNSRINV